MGGKGIGMGGNIVLLIKSIALRSAGRFPCMKESLKKKDFMLFVLVHIILKRKEGNKKERKTQVVAIEKKSRVEIQKPSREQRTFVQ